MKSLSVKSGFGLGAVIAVAAAIIALPIRTVQFFTIIESDTGFYSEVNSGVYLLYAVIAIAVAACLVLGIAKRKKLDYSLEAIKRPGFGILSFTAAIGALSDSAKCIMEFMNYQPDTGTSGAAGILLGAEAIFALFTAIFFVAIGASALSGKTSGSEYKIIALAPVLWSVFRVIYRFTRTISYVRVSELMFEMLMLVFLILFFMAFAQSNANVDSKGNNWKVAAYGMPAVLFALICFVPRFIVTVSGNAHLLVDQSPIEYCDIANAAFILCTVLTRVTDKISSEEEA